MVAFDDGPLEWSPTWTCLDYFENFVSGVDISRGRQSELDLTEASTATVYLNDRDGLFDDGSPWTPWAGKLDGKQIMLQCWDPVELEWVQQWRGRIRNIGYDFNPATISGVSILSNVQLECVDLLADLARVNFVVGVFGDTPPAGSEGVVYYNASPVDDRIVAMLIEAGLSSDWYVVFTGNVDVQAMVYNAADVLLAGISDACDAEFPGIANRYTDRFGRFVFHGRGARFDPDTVSASAGDAAWDFQRWKVGDGAAIALDSARAQIRPPLRWSRGLDKIINSAYATNRGILEANKAGQVVEDATSITAYGRMPWSAEGLIVKEGTTTGNTAKDEAKLYAQFWVNACKDPVTRVDEVTLKSIRPGDARGAATWAPLLRADVSDIIDVEHGYPGGVGVSAEFYVEGSTMSVRPLNRDFDMVERTFSLSPVSYYGDPLGLLG